MPTAARPYIPPPAAPLEVLYLDNNFLAINKPSGLLTVPGRGPGKQDCLLHRLQQDYPDALVVHRLDMETSGIVLFARNVQAQGVLGKCFADRSIAKQYIALVHGELSSSAGEIDLPLIADWPNRPKQKVDHETGKPSKTHYRVIETGGDTSRVALTPVTGRSHQLRVHMMSLGHPIVGDSLYGYPGDRVDGRRLMLHAQDLAFTYPGSEKPVRIECLAPF